MSTSCHQSVEGLEGFFRDQKAVKKLSAGLNVARATSLHRAGQSREGEEKEEEGEKEAHNLVGKGSLVPPEGLHVFSTDVVNVTQAVVDVRHVHIRLTFLDTRHEHSSGPLISVIGPLREILHLQFKTLLIPRKILGLKLVRLTQVHDSECPVWVRAGAVDVLLDRESLCEGLEWRGKG